jgi:hypothetical protein
MSKHELILLPEEEQKRGGHIYQYRYGDWLLRWAGWKMNSDGGDPFGQWVAVDIRDGVVVGLCTSTSDYDWTVFGGEARMRAEGWAKAESQDRLIEFIDEKETV